MMWLLVDIFAGVFFSFYLLVGFLYTLNIYFFLSLSFFWQTAEHGRFGSIARTRDTFSITSGSRANNSIRYCRRSEFLISFSFGSVDLYRLQGDAVVDTFQFSHHFARAIFRPPLSPTGLYFRVLFFWWATVILGSKCWSPRFVPVAVSKTVCPTSGVNSGWMMTELAVAVAAQLVTTTKRIIRIKLNFFHVICW